MARILLFVVSLVSALVQPVAGQGMGLRGVVHTVDGGTAAGARVFVACAGARDSAVVDSTGHFQIEVPCAAAVGLVEIVDPSGRYLPSMPRIRPRVGGGEPAFLLTPRVWKIASGTHAGQAVPVDLVGATTRACRACAAFFSAEDTVNMRPPGIPVWLEHSLPLRVAFSQEDGVTMTESDSVAFMSVAHALEVDLGRRWFQPAREEEVFGDPAAEDLGSIIVAIDPGLTTAGRGNWAAQGGEIVAGVIYLQSTSLISNPRYAGVVAHELMHTLGFGHTCSWRTVVAAERCPGRRSDSPTPEDVAHAQLLLRLRTLERHYGIYGSVAAAIAGLEKYPHVPVPAQEPAPAVEPAPLVGSAA
ncbi:MAG: hypothetical protein KY464_16970 [Gemmatimonadetes bacterium]|nr:hypothetical protein [Gemmatimonadota bacterium]